VCALGTLLTSAGRQRQDYLYINSPGGAFSVILFLKAVILWTLVRLAEK